MVTEVAIERADVVPSRPDQSTEDVDPGEWAPMHDAEGGVKGAWVRCPECGLVIAVSLRNHDVSDIGEVEPVIQCDGLPDEGCKWGAWVTLQQWPPDEVDLELGLDEEAQAFLEERRE